MFSVVDTGAGPNLISKELLPDDQLVKVRKNRELVNLVDANEQPLHLTGLISLPIQVGTYKATITFVAVGRLSADIILGCDFLDNHTEWIGTKSKSPILAEGTEVPIIRRPAGKLESSQAPPPWDQCPRRREIPHSRVRVARRIILPPQSETVVSATSADAGLFFLLPDQRLFDRCRALLSNGIAEVQSNTPFEVIVANFGDNPVTLSKSQVLGYAIPQNPAEVISIVENTTVESPLISGLPMKATPPSSLLSKDSKTGFEDPSMTRQSLDDLDLGHLDPATKHKVLQMLSKHSSMWQGHLGEMKVRPHRIALKPGAKPVHAHPYRAGPEARRIEESEITRMLDAKVIEPAQSEWASPVVMIPKSDGKIPFL